VNASSPCGSLLIQRVERAMGIEPTAAARLEAQNMAFGGIGRPKFDGRANFYGMWGHVGLRKER